MLGWMFRNGGTDNEDIPDDLRQSQDEKRLPVHIMADDARLSIEDGLVRIQSDGAERILRLGEISSLSIHGGATLTAPALRAQAKAAVPVVLHSRSGSYTAQLVNLSGSHAETRRAQYAAATNPTVALDIARALVEAKIRNAARLMRRRMGAADAVTKRLERDALSATRAKSMDTLRGLEGAAAAAWFGAWPRLLTSNDAMFAFCGRTRRPAQDAVNALISYLYAVLAGQMAAATLAAGLDPNVGFLHAERPGRPALALDLIEPLRTAVVDAGVIAALNNGEFDAVDFAVQPDGGMRLTDQGRRTALSVLERRLSTVLSYDGMNISWRAAMSHQALALARRLRKGSGPLPTPSPK